MSNWRDKGMKQAELIRIAILAYWKSTKHHMVGAIEAKNADVLTVNRSLMLTESEVKTSIADMQREVKTKQSKHWRMTRGYPPLYPEAHYFYFVVPENLADKAIAVCNERYPYAGLLICNDEGVDIYYPHNITCLRQAKRFKRPKVNDRELLQIAYASTNTALRYIKGYLATPKDKE